MPRLNGLDACERIRQRNPQAKLIFLTMAEDPDTAGEAIRRGASGYLLKASAPGELFEAIRTVLGGLYLRVAGRRGWARRRVRRTGRTLEAGRPEPPRTGSAAAARRGQVDEGSGRSPRRDTPYIAFHDTPMMERLGLRTGAELVQHAVALGLVVKRQPAV